MGYKIKFNYDTGDSFSNESDCIGYLEYEWEDIDIAKANLKRIEEHYKQYRELEYSYNKKETNQEILSRNKDKDWFVNEPRLVAFVEYNGKPSHHAIDEKSREIFEKAGKEIGYIIDETAAQNKIKLQLDNGKWVTEWPTWCGYFEHLNYVELESKDLDTKIYF